MDKRQQFPAQGLRQALVPLARLCLRLGFGYQDFTLVVRRAFVDAGQLELKSRAEAASISRVSVLTGINRNDVARVLREEDAPPEEGYNMLSRVLAYWQSKSPYRSSRGPKPLSCIGSSSNFAALVGDVSKHLNFKTVLNELEHAGAVRIEDGMVHLQSQEYPRAKDLSRSADLLAKDIGTLSQAVFENVTIQESMNLHLRTSYDNVFVASIPLIREWLTEQGREFHRRLREFLSSHDADLAAGAPAGAKAGAKISFTSVGYIDPENS